MRLDWCGGQRIGCGLFRSWDLDVPEVRVRGARVAPATAEAVWMAGWSTRDRASRINMPERRVLVVDDDEAIREVARAALELVGGWSVTTVGSGQDAHVVASALEPDAVLLDVMMPGRDGLATVESMRADPATRDIPVIFLTAKAPPDGARAWQGVGLAGVIRKPFDPMTLASDIARLLGWDE